MPITICKIHGERGCPEMCEHLYKDLRNGIVTPFFALPVMTIRMCEACYEKHNVKEVYDFFGIDQKTIEDIWTGKILEYCLDNVRSEKKDNGISDRLNTIYSELHKNSGFKCDGCVDEIRLKHAKQNNLPPPFEAFGNTLMHYQDNRVNDLEERLSNYLNPEKVQFGKKDWDIVFGSLRAPFTINICGAETEEEQLAVLKIIDDFFTGISQNQRRVVFRESLEWIRNERGSHSAKQPKIISDIIVKA